MSNPIQSYPGLSNLGLLAQYSQTPYNQVSGVPLPLPPPPSQKPLMKTVIDDIKNFIREHRSLIYGVLLILLIDHFFLGGKLKERVRAMAEKLFGVVEKKVDTLAASPGGAQKP